MLKYNRPAPVPTRQFGITMMANPDGIGPPPPPHTTLPGLSYKESYHPTYHAHPEQQIHDNGPRVRQSKLPLFKQVRSMLHKPPPIVTPGNAKFDRYTGELSESGVAPNVKPSTYEAAFKASRRPSPERPSNRSRRNLSPVSVLRDDEVAEAIPDQAPAYEASTYHISPYSHHDLSPVSPVEEYGSEDDAEHEFVPDLMPEPLSPNVQRAPQPPQTPPSPQQIKRKPVSRRVSTAENEPPVSPPQRRLSDISDSSRRFSSDGRGEAQAQPNSRFSWTTYAPSVFPAERSSIDAGGRPSIDAMTSLRSKNSVYDAATREPKQSHFSWSTVQTAATNRGKLSSPPSSPPRVPPAKLYTGPPVQSILSRQRPIKRIEKEEWTPPARKPSPRSGTTSPDSSTPISLKTAYALPLPKDRHPAFRAASPASTTSTSGPGKALPPPPTELNLSHLESLQVQERSLALQRRNVQKGIAELEKIEKASPLDVPFATVRDAKKRLEEYRKRLAEVLLEEREVGIAVTRARRKEEEEEGFDGATLWVRRVTS